MTTSPELPPLDILTLAYDYPPGHDTGMGTHIYELAKGLGRLGWHATVLVPHRDDIPSTAFSTPEGRATWEAANVDVHRVPASAATQALDKNPDENPAGLLMARNTDLEAHALSLVRGGLKPAMLHCHDFFLIPAAMRLKQALGIPLVVTVHMLFEPMFRWWGQTVLPGISELERTMCREADAIITVSQSTAEVIIRTHELPSGRVHVVYNGFDTPGFTRLAPLEQDTVALRERYGVGDDQVVLYAGRIARQKGIRELAQSAAHVLAQHPGTTYLLAGPTSSAEFGYATGVQQRLQEDARLRAKVRFIGKMPRPELVRLYRLADVAVVPSLYETFGYAATEAMALGVPVVAARAGGLAEIIEHDRSGLLVPTRVLPDGAFTVDVQELATAQLKLLRDRPLARQLGEAARDRVRTAFTYDEMVKGTARIYQAVHARAR